MDLLNIIKEYWTIIVAVISIVVAFVNVKSQNSEQERRIEALEKDNCSIKETNSVIKTTLTQIQVEIQWIKEALTRK